MSKMIQIRNVPEPVHRRLKARAAQEGLTLSDLLLREATRLAEQPTLTEVLERIRKRPTVDLSAESIVHAVRAEREGRL